VLAVAASGISPSLSQQLELIEVQALGRDLVLPDLEQVNERSAERATDGRDDIAAGHHQSARVRAAENCLLHDDIATDVLVRDRYLVIRDTVGPDGEELLGSVSAPQLDTPRRHDRRALGVALSKCLSVARTPRLQPAVRDRFGIGHGTLLVVAPTTEPTPSDRWRVDGPRARLASQRREPKPTGARTARPHARRRPVRNESDSPLS
jgi:hypothetical protein